MHILYELRNEYQDLSPHEAGRIFVVSCCLVWHLGFRCSGLSEFCYQTPESSKHTHLSTIKRWCETYGQIVSHHNSEMVEVLFRTNSRMNTYFRNVDLKQFQGSFIILREEACLMLKTIEFTHGRVLLQVVKLSNRKQARGGAKAAGDSQW